MDFNKACRLCLDLPPDAALDDTDSDGHSNPLNENLKLKIYACTSLKVRSGNGLPGSVCDPCMRLLDKFFLFRKMCWDVDSKLNLYFSDNVETSATSTVTIPEPVRLDEDQLDTPIEIKDSWTSRSRVKEEDESSGDENEYEDAENDNDNENDIENENENEIVNENENNAAGNSITESVDVVMNDDDVSNVTSAPPSSKPEFYCDICNLEFKGAPHLKIHKEDVHPDTSKPTYHCKICTKPYRQLKRLENHLKIHEALGELKKDEENKVNSNDSDSDSQQQRINEGENDKGDFPILSGELKKKKNRKVYDCEYCDQVFHSYTKYTLHELTHTGEKKYNCSDCSRSFTHKHSLVGHIREQHTGEVNFTCDVCGRGFVHRSTYNIHIKTHSTEKNLKCPDCDKCFTQMKNLRVHRQIHTASRSHTCQVCGKSFNFLKTLKVHLVLHSGEKPYVCTYCGKAFAQSAPLKTHTRIHTGERPYECKLCPTSYSTSNALKVHVLKHSGEAPYSCKVCNKGFNRKKDMIAHQEENHEVRVFDDVSHESNTLTQIPQNSVHNSAIGMQQNCMILQGPPPLVPMPMLLGQGLSSDGISSHQSPPPLLAHPISSHNHTQMTLHSTQQLHTLTHHPDSHIVTPSDCMSLPHPSNHYNSTQLPSDLPGTDCSGG